MLEKELAPIYISSKNLPIMSIFLDGHWHWILSNLFQLGVKLISAGANLIINQNIYLIKIWHLIIVWLVFLYEIEDGHFIFL